MGAIHAPFGSSWGGGIPSSALLAKGIGITDTLNQSNRTLQQLKHIAVASTQDFTHASISGTETITDKQGTSTVTVAAGKITVGAGTLWSFQISNGSRYEYATPLSATKGVVFDVSGGGLHLLFTVADQAAMDALCISSREKGSNWLDREGSLTIANSAASYPYPSSVSIDRTVKNIIKNSELSGSGTTPTGWTLYVNGGSCNIIPSTIFTGENAIQASATNARVSMGYTLPSNLVAGHKYVIGCYVESVSGVSNDDGLQIFSIGGGSPVVTQGHSLGIVHNGVTGYVMREFVVVSGTSLGPRFGVGVSSDDTGTVTFSRPFLIDITNFSNESIFPSHEYVKTVSTDTSGKEQTFSSSQQSMNISVWGDSLVGNSSLVAFMQTGSSVYIYNAGVGGETSGQIKIRFDAQINKHGDVTIFWAGRNDWASPSVVKSNIAAMVASLPHSNFLVVGVLAKADGTEGVGSPTRNTIDQLNADLSVIYGNKFLDLNVALSSNSTRTDGLHLNEVGSFIAAQSMISFIKIPNKWFSGQAKLPITPVSNPTDTTLVDDHTYSLADSHQMRVVTGWTYGTANTFYNADGTPKTLTGAALKAAGAGPLLWIGDSKWLAFKSASEAKRALKVPVS